MENLKYIWVKFKVCTIHSQNVADDTDKQGIGVHYGTGVIKVKYMCDDLSSTIIEFLEK